MKTRIFVYLFAFVGLLASCSSHKTSAYGPRQSVIVNAEAGGVYAVEARGRAIKHDVLETSRYEAMTACKRQAVMDVLFEILPTRNMVEKTMKPVLMEVNIKQKQEDYFNAFFAGKDKGTWHDYVKSTGTRAAAPKFSETANEMVCDMVVYVDRAGLKARMKADGILP